MSNTEHKRQLWKQIGIEQSPLYSSDYFSREGGVPFIQEMQGDRSSVLSTTKHFDYEDGKSQNGQVKVQRKMLDKVVEKKGTQFSKMMEELNMQIVKIEENEEIQIVEDVSKVEQVISLTQRHQYSIYNEDIGDLPSSMTPLVYSKNSKRFDEVRFRKGHVQLSLLKMNLYQARRQIQSLKNYLNSFFSVFRGLQSNLQEQVGQVYSELEKYYSSKAQESILNQKQEFQQLKQKYNMLKAKEEYTKTLVKSQYIIPDMEVSQMHSKTKKDQQNIISELKSQNQVLKQRISKLQDQKQSLLKEAQEFKGKISEIESKTLEIRESNDKLYQYIFDLQQTVAYHKEELPKVTQNVRAEFQDKFRQQSRAFQQEREGLQCTQIQLRKDLLSITEEKTSLSNDLNVLETLFTDLKIEFASKSDEIQQLTDKNTAKTLEIQQLVKKQDEQNYLYKQIISEKDQMLESAQSIQKNQSQTPYTSRMYEQFNKKPRDTFMRELQDIKESDERKLLEALELQIIVLQKDNIQLRHTLELYSNNYRPTAQPSMPSRQATTHSIQNHYLSSPRSISQSQPSHQQNLLIKERQLKQYQNYLDSQAKKIDDKHRQLELQELNRKTKEKTQRQNSYTHQRAYDFTANQDDYGIRKTSNVYKTTATFPTQHRKNNFCSSQAQTIIERVKSKQRSNLSNNSHCEHTGHCRCDVYSKGSRESQDSLGKDYYRVHNNYVKTHASPLPRDGDYLPSREKSNKMRMIEDKVKRLKNQLKTSLTTAMKK